MKPSLKIHLRVLLAVFTALSLILTHSPSDRIEARDSEFSFEPASSDQTDTTQAQPVTLTFENDQVQASLNADFDTSALSLFVGGPWKEQDPSMEDLVFTVCLYDGERIVDPSGSISINLLFKNQTLGSDCFLIHHLDQTRLETTDMDRIQEEQGTRIRFTVDSLSEFRLRSTKSAPIQMLYLYDLAGNMISQVSIDPGMSFVLPQWPTGNIPSSGRFMGWSTSSQYIENGEVWKYHPLYPPGSTIVWSEEDAQSTQRLYPVWAPDGADYWGDYFIRLDGTIPNEPTSSPAGAYTNVIPVYGAMNYVAPRVDASGILSGPDQQLAKEPTVEQLETVINEKADQIGYGSRVVGDTLYKTLRIDGVWLIVDAASQPVQPDEQGSMPADAVRLTVLWYVIKKETYNWHIDGVLLESSEYSLIYSSGAAGTGEVRNMPDGRSLAPGTTVHVGHSLNNPDSAAMTPTRAGYIFAGWQDRQTGQIWQPSDTFVLTKNTVLQAFWIPSAGHSLRIMKRDEQNDDPLAGAIFSLESRNESSDEWQLDASRLETQADGSTIFVGLQTARIYRLSEREEPPGYQSMDPICFRIVNENGTLQGFLCDPDGNRIENPEPILSVYGQTDSLMIALSLTNIPWIGHLMVQKTDLHGNPLYGAQYQLIQIRQGISTVITSGVSDRDGFVQFENGADLSLRDGTYRLEEIQAPDGCLLMEPVDLNIQDSRIEIQERAGITLEESEDGYRLIAADSPGMILPETGSTGRLMVILTSILCLTAALWVFRYKHLYSKGI